MCSSESLARQKWYPDARKNVIYRRFPSGHYGRSFPSPNVVFFFYVNVIKLSYSSSSSILGLVSVEDVGLGPAPVPLERTDSRAALMLCVAEYFSLGTPWSMLGRCFFIGLPTKASAGKSPPP